MSVTSVDSIIKLNKDNYSNNASQPHLLNTTAQSFSVVHFTLPGHPFDPPLNTNDSRKIVTSKTQKYWNCRNAIVMGCVGLPHLRTLVDCSLHGLSDEQQKVRMTFILFKGSSHSLSLLWYSFSSP